MAESKSTDSLKHNHAPGWEVREKVADCEHVPGLIFNVGGKDNDGTVAYWGCCVCKANLENELPASIEQDQTSNDWEEWPEDRPPMPTDERGIE